MRALAAATVAAAMPRLSSAGSRVTPASSMPIPASLNSAASASYLSAVSGLPPSNPPCEPVTTIAPTCSGPTAEAESSAHTAGGSAGQARPAAERDRRGIGVADDAARHHIGAVADARAHMADRGGRYAEPGEILKPLDAGLVAPDPGIVED